MQVRNGDSITQEVAEEMRSYKVVKANSMIQRARFHLSVQEQKVVLFLISKIKPDDDDFLTHSFSVAEFCRVCGIDYDNGKNYQNVKATLKNLSDKSVWAMDGDWERLYRWIDQVSIYKKTGFIEIKLHNCMIPYLLHLQERFTQYELVHTIAMKSQYSIRMYELFKSYEYRGRCKIGIDELKEMLFATNYVRFPHFKEKVLDIALREINTLTDLTITYTIIKIGRKYGQIEFDINIKKDPTEKMTAWKEREKSLNYKDSDDYTYGHKQ